MEFTTPLTVAAMRIAASRNVSSAGVGGVIARGRKRVSTGAAMPFDGVDRYL
jgi:hypothetical protein